MKHEFSKIRSSLIAHRSSLIADIKPRPCRRKLCFSAAFLRPLFFFSLLGLLPGCNPPDGGNSNKQFTVVYDLNGGSGTPPPTVKVVEGGTIADAPAAPTPPADKIFDKWTTDSAGSNEFEFGTTKVAADTTLFAQYLRLFTVTYTRKGRSFPTVTIPDSTGTPPPPVEVAVGGTIPRPPDSSTMMVSLPGWAVIGWRLNNTNFKFDYEDQPGTLVTSDITLDPDYGVASFNYEGTAGEFNEITSTTPTAPKVSGNIVGYTYEITLDSGDSLPASVSIDSATGAITAKDNTANGRYTVTATGPTGSPTLPTESVTIKVP